MGQAAGRGLDLFCESREVGSQGIILPERLQVVTQSEEPTLRSAMDRIKRDRAIDTEQAAQQTLVARTLCSRLCKAVMSHDAYGSFFRVVSHVNDDSFRVLDGADRVIVSVTPHRGGAVFVGDASRKGGMADDYDAAINMIARILLTQGIN